MAARSFYIQLVNAAVDLSRKDMGLSHGEWSNGGSMVPPEHVSRRSRAQWESESDGFMTGTEGFVVYSSDSGDVTIKWDNPFAGGNALSVDLPPSLQATWGDISGNNAAVTITLVENF